MTKQTKAQRLADFLKGVTFLSDLQSGLSPITGYAIAAELRRLDANEAALLEALKELNAAGDNSVDPEDGNDFNAMLRFGRAVDAARAIITRIEAERNAK